MIGITPGQSLHPLFCTERRLCLAGQAGGKALARRDFLGLGVGAQTSVQTPGMGTGTPLCSMQAPPQEGGAAPYCTGAVSGPPLSTGGRQGVGVAGGGGGAVRGLTGPRSWRCVGCGGGPEARPRGGRSCFTTIYRMSGLKSGRRGVAVGRVVNVVSVFVSLGERFGGALLSSGSGG